MAENIEFIPAYELPVAEGDEVSVLCLENGELKQKAANGLGGNATDYDIIVRFTCSWNQEEGDVLVDAETISGSYDAVLQKLDNGIIPSALFIARGTFFDLREIKAVEKCTPSWMRYPDENAYLLFSALYSFCLDENGNAWVD